MTVVLDASAMLAYLHHENGAEIVEKILMGAVISSVNWSEVLQKAMAHNIDTAGLWRIFRLWRVSVMPFDSEDAAYAAQLWQTTKGYGLSMGDRACLALGWKLKSTVYTADRIWQEIALLTDLSICVIR